MRHKLIQGDCLRVLKEIKETFDVCFSDPPDAIGLKYNEYNDRMKPEQYRALLEQWVEIFVEKAPIVWLSFNSKWTFALGVVVDRLVSNNSDWEAKPFVQHFTFGQNCKTDCGNGHRPLWRLRRKGTPIYPDQIKVASWRELNGDKRAAKGGRVPLDAWDFPRVTGNSKQRRSHHPTQLHEGLVERAIKLSTLEGQHVLDPFGGTGTTLRVCKDIKRRCTLIEIDQFYCDKIAEEHPDLARKAA